MTGSPPPAAGRKRRRATPGWGERFFHIADPDGDELSFAWPLAKPASRPSSRPQRD